MIEKAPKPTSKTSKSRAPPLPNTAAPPFPNAAAHVAGAPPSLPAPNGGPSNTTSNSESLGAALDTPAMDKIRDLINKSLQVADLKTWIESHNASTTAKTKKGKHPTSYNYAYQWIFCIIDLVQFIIGTATVPIPSVEDIQIIVASVSNSPTFTLYAFIYIFLAKS